MQILRMFVHLLKNSGQEFVHVSIPFEIDNLESAKPIHKLPIAHVSPLQTFTRRL